MAESIKNQILQSISTAHAAYHRLILLVGNSGSGKTSVLQGLAVHFNQSVINVNLGISKKLLEFPIKQRPLKISELISDLIGSGDTPAILDNLELLFDTELKQDPLRLLLGNARNRVVVASWNGTYKDGKLTYAETGHPEHRVYDASDIKDVILICTEQGDKAAE